MVPTRKSQPYRQNPNREPSQVLDMMRKGTGPHGNPADDLRRQRKVLAILKRMYAR
jgi:hypothetical protein